VTEGPEGILRELRAAQLLVEMSTVGPRAIERLAAGLPAGARLVDAPVLGSLAEAERGSLVLFLGGSQADVRELEPLLAELGRPLHVGPLGSGAAAKLVANNALFASLAALGETLALADSLGLDRGTAFRVLAETPLAAQADRRRAAIMGEPSPARFALGLARKDATLVVDEAAKRGADLRVAPAVLSWFADADRAGAGVGDYTALLGFILGRAT